MLFAKAKELKLLHTVWGKTKQNKTKSFKFYDTTLTKEIKLTKLVDINCSIYKKNDIQVTNKGVS